MRMEIGGKDLTLADLHAAWLGPVHVDYSKDTERAIKQAEDLVKSKAQGKEAVYGLNTGFGKFAEIKISVDEIEVLQERIVLSHSAGVGKPITHNIARMLMLLKAHSLARGYFGIKQVTLDLLISLLNADVYPYIPSQGSVGASGDLAPLAHLSMLLLGKGKAEYQGQEFAGEKL
jgi:histidine ammonia-lyase